MWSQCGDFGLKTWFPNHFVPLVEKQINADEIEVISGDTENNEMEKQSEGSLQKLRPKSEKNETKLACDDQLNSIMDCMLYPKTNTKDN